MMNAQYIDEFCSDVFPNANAGSLRQLYSVLNKMSQFENKTGLELEQFKTSDFVAMFNKYQWVKMYTEFFPYKSILVSYLQWLAAVKAIPVESLGDLRKLSASDLNGDERFEQFYFKTEEDFVSAILEAMPEDDFIREKASCILYWLGFSTQQISELKISDVSPEENRIGSVLNVPRPLMEIVSHCATVYSFNRRKCNDSIVSYEFPNSQYVIKRLPKGKKFTEISEDDTTDYYSPIPVGLVRRFTSNATRQFQTISKTSIYYGKKISQKSLYNNNLYCKMYEFEHSGTDITNTFLDKSRREKLREALSLQALPSREATLLRSSYLQWKNHFYQ